MGASSFLLLSSVQHVCVRYFSWCSDQTPDPLSPQKILRKARFILAYGLGGNIVCHIGEGRNTGAKPASDITSEGRKQIAVKVGWRSAHFLLLVLNSSPGGGGDGAAHIQVAPPSSVQPPWKSPPRHTQRSVSMVILNAV